MLSLWIASIFVFTSLVEAEQGLADTAQNRNIINCPQSENCTKLGGQCFRKNKAPDGAQMFEIGGKKVHCNEIRRCLCYKLNETETSSTSAPEKCFHPEIEHVGNDLVLPPPKANSSEECKQKCADFPGCKHFSYFSIEDGECKAAISENIPGNETVRGNCYLKNETNETHNMCSVSGSLSCQGERQRGSFWQNDWDDRLEYKCPAGQTIYRIRSEHSNYREDRRWRFDCGYSTIRPDQNCGWSGYANWWDDALTYVCPYGKVITGVYSHHDNGREDRRWKYWCCGKQNYCYSSCKFHGDINYWDNYMDYWVPNGYYLAGFTSVHDNYREDRRWRVLLCQMKAC